MPPAEGRVEAGGRRLEYRLLPASRAGRPTLVFLHEGLGSVELWRDFPAQVAAATGCAALVYSRAGHGRSQPPLVPRTPAYLHEEAGRVLPEVLAALGVGEPVLVGHSDGASIALLYAGGRHAPPARGVVAMAPHVFVEEEALAGIRAAAGAYRGGGLRERLARYHDAPDALFFAWHDIWRSPAFRDWNIEGVLAGIRCPVLALQGVDDEYGTLAQLERIAARAPRVETLALPACGHTPFRDQPEATLSATVRFVEGLG